MAEAIESASVPTSSETIRLSQLINFSVAVENLYRKGAIHMSHSDRDIHKHLQSLSALAEKTVEDFEERCALRQHAIKTVVGAAIYVACKKLGIITRYIDLNQALGVTTTALFNPAKRQYVHHRKFILIGRIDMSSSSIKAKILWWSIRDNLRPILESETPIWEQKGSVKGGMRKVGGT